MKLIILILALALKAVFSVAGLVVVPVALLFTKRRSMHLPGIFWPWDNDEAFYGINGGHAWRREHPNSNHPWWRFQWLAIKNPAFNLSKYWLGVYSDRYTFRGSDWNTVEKLGGWHVGTIDRRYLQLFYHGRIYVRIGWRHVSGTSARLCFIMKRGSA